VARLDTGMAWAEDPPSRTRHVIGNLEAAPLENGEVQAKTAFLVYRSHLETDHQLLSGCREDVLRKVNGASKVRRRTIVLDANVLLDKRLPLRVKTNQLDASQPLSRRSRKSITTVGYAPFLSLPERGRPEIL
jgi:3-phenylpropionate/cinnamic acid dioxygenase small subunit